MKKRIVTVLGLTVACAGIAFGTYTLTSQGGGAAHPARAAESTEIADYIASVLPHTSPDQAAALADGVVTFEENEEALTRNRACMEAAGYEVFDLVPAEGKRSSQAGFTRQPPAGQSTDVSAQESRDIGADCRRQHSDNVAEVWTKQQPRPTAAELNNHYEHLKACVASAGETDQVTPSGPVWVVYSGAPETTITIRRSQTQAYIDCARRVQVETGLYSPPPTYTDGAPGAVVPNP